MARKTGGSRKGKKNQKYMIYLVSGIMLFSGFFMATRTLDDNQSDTSDVSDDPRLITYSLRPIGNITGLVRVGAPQSEVALVPKNPEILNIDSISAVLNQTFNGTDNPRAEISNAMILFRFGVLPDVFNSEEFIGLIRPFIGDLTMYRVYDGFVGSGKLSLLASEGLPEGGYVRAILLERQDTFETMGLMQALVAVGPRIEARVVGLSGFNFKASSPDLIEDSTLLDEFDAEDIKITPKDSSINQTDYLVSFNLPEGADVADAKMKVSRLGLTGLTVSRMGFVGIPRDIMVGNDLLQASNNDSSTALLSLDARINDSLNVTVVYEKVGGVLTSLDLIDSSLE